MRSSFRGLHTALLLGCSLLPAVASAQTQAPAAPQAMAPLAGQRQIGPAPTRMALEANRGPFQIMTMQSPRNAGFGGGTIHFPVGTMEGPFGVIAVVPGFISAQQTIQWWGPRLASNGFVVITIDTLTPLDVPDQRVGELRAALDAVIAESKRMGSPLMGLVDTSKQAVMGWSFGGGASLLSAAKDPTLKAIIPFAPFNFGAATFNTIKVPTFIISCERDAVAAVNQHANPFFQAIPNTTPKLNLEVRGGQHTCGNTGNPDMDVLGKVGTAFMKRFMDGDTRFTPFLCGREHEADVANPRISNARDNCMAGGF